jgi:hypothetical protein
MRALTLVLLVLVISMPANAGRLWCKSDPVILLDGRVVDVTVSIPLEMTFAVNGPVEFTIWTPAGVDRSVIVQDIGYMGQGATVIFKNSRGTVRDNKIPTVVRVIVPIDEAKLGSNDDVPVELSIIPENSWPTVAYGTHLGTSVSLTILGR